MNAASSRAAAPSAAPSEPALAWAQRLVRIDTRSQRSNLPLIETIADHLRALGVPLRLTYDETRQKANLFATLGAGKPAGVVLSGHTDTVPWDGQEWTLEPLAAEVRRTPEPRLYGRGSADMKGFIGCVVAQTERLLAADLPFAVHYAFSYDEEVGGFGARGLIADLRDAGLTPRICLVGEPTGMIPALGHKGVYRWRCHVRGHAAHSSRTPFAVNAVEHAARVIARIADLADELRERGPRRAGYDVPWSTAAVCVVEGGVADNIVPEACRVHYEFRNLPGIDADALQSQVSDYAATLEPAMKAIDATSGIRFERTAAMPEFEAKPDEPALRLAERLAATSETTLVGFGTEAGLFQRAGLSTIVCGPGSIAQAHQADEFVALEQLARCENFVRGLLAPEAAALALL
ncbi:MAG: acetylornithine deacetylase [Burkholderiales bacterium]|nr:acetylornithine deacetylase [Burkholderiales bacterium]